MADAFGALSFPLAAPGAGTAAGDPTLDYFGAFVQAILRSKLQTAWRSITSVGQDICKTVITNDPNESEFNKEDMPILFVWSSDDHEFETLKTDDWRPTGRNVHLLWAQRPADQAERSERSTMFNAIAKAIRISILRGRDSAWVLAGDTDPTAATLGSVLIEQCKLLQWPDVKSCKASTRMIHVDDMEPRPYSVVEATIQIVENTVWDATLRGDPAKTSVDVTNNAVTMARFRDPPAAS